MNPKSTLAQMARSGRTAAFAVAVSLSVLSIQLASPLSAAHPRPNVVLITADDLGCELGCYGDQTVPTPHLDSLARDGALFERAFVTSASCSPSRSSIFPSLYPHQNGQIGLSHRGLSMHPDQVTLPALLKQAGYYTGVIGKAHVAPNDSLPFDFDTNPRVPGSKLNDIPLATRLINEFFDARPDVPFFLLVAFFDPHHPPEGNNNYTHDQIQGLPEHTVAPGDVKPFPFLKSAKVLPTGGGAGDEFGASIGVSFDTIIAGGHLPLKEAGIHVPDDVWVIGFDDLPLSARMETPLTTLSVSKRDMGRRAFDLLAARIAEGRDCPAEKVLIDRALIVRAVCERNLELSADDVLLEACCQDARALVSKDRATLPGWLALRVADGREHGGVSFYDFQRPLGRSDRRQSVSASAKATFDRSEDRGVTGLGGGGRQSEI
jgi:hypothetical protein